MAAADKYLEHQFMDDDTENGFKAKNSVISRISRGWQATLKALAALLIFVCLILFIARMRVQDMKFRQNDQPIRVQNPSLLCKDSKLRQEWRTLDRSEQAEYIAAVNCLRDSPSSLGLDQTLYHDFPLIHSQVGNYSE